MKRFLIIALILMTFLLSSCEKNIIVQPHSFKSQLSVECILEPNNVPKLFLGKTVGYFDKRILNKDLFVADAVITITGANKTDTLKVAHKYNYYRCTDEYFYLGSIPIIQGRNYHLKIKYGAEIYESDTRTNVSAAVIDSVTYISSFADFYGEHEGVVVMFHDIPNEKNNYRYRMDRVLDSSSANVGNCAKGPYRATEIGRSIFFDTNIDGAKMKIIIEPAFKHNKGDTALVYLQTLDDASARFFDDLDRQKTSKVNPFIEPVFIHSNIPGAFGIFGACNYSKAVKFVYPE
jgi:hypothetical protein